MTLKLHGAYFSTCTQRVSIILKEKNVPFHMVVVDFMKGEHKGPEHLKIQPFGMIPFLEDEGFHLYESRAIARYLEAKYKDQGTPLLPPASDLKATALAEQWMSVEFANFDAHAGLIAFEILYKRFFNMETNPARVTELRAKLEATLDVYNTILGTRPYLAGDQVSLADLFHLPNGAKLIEAGLEEAFTLRPNVKAWWDRISARKSWKETVAATATQ
ncbi:hypothetical protein HK104_009876 [Borealophlyctis nickersoniae]|nr:hypothetical protein HK104_009876 [Borealophlyctis nickersoniae]